jgi:hypothetical protein
MSRLEPIEIIRVSLASLPDDASLELKGAVVALGLQLGGYQIVPIGERSAPSSVPKIAPAIAKAAPAEAAAAPAPEEKRKDPIRFPFHCPICNKIKGNRETAEECDNSRCPV